MWGEPITFETATLGKYWTVTSTAEAARALMERWPVTAGPAYEAALRTCLAVMEGKVRPAEARQAFLNAAEEADVFIRP
ncbi:DUF982 domain-containing protein [Shinella curvata]|uniref:DUF982 domain-containing protein n=2 Tax=Shinella curvata TaxID=1817964 RepID=A0ABT8XHQ0_9HYPH|nr:DUF982 domain-containing protein [Shinella curvata]MCJ8053920.1 DUF982 domain-containing protein [Shinella curvata]MDO6123252.1 DUF982 domain-containing protein [Shinella curvata]